MEAARSLRGAPGAAFPCLPRRLAPLPSRSTSSRIQARPFHAGPLLRCSRAAPLLRKTVTAAASSSPPSGAAATTPPSPSPAAAAPLPDSGAPGANLDGGGGCYFRVWAPHATTVDAVLRRCVGPRGKHPGCPPPPSPLPFPVSRPNRPPTLLEGPFRARG